MEYYPAIKKSEIMPSAATWLDLEIFILSEVSQTEKDKYHMILLIYRVQNRKRLTDIENKIIVTKGKRGVERGIN